MCECARACVRTSAICLYACYLFVYMLRIPPLRPDETFMRKPSSFGVALGCECDGRGLVDGGRRQLVPLSGVLIPNKRDTGFTKLVNRLQASKNAAATGQHSLCGC